MTFRWFLSRQFRQTSDLWGRLRSLRDTQSDLLAPQDLQLLDTALREAKAALDADAGDETLAARDLELEQAAQQSLRPYPHPEWRENVEVLLMAIVIAISVRAFFAQPFKIPTGSMQPTLYGVTVQDRRGDPSFVMPGLWKRAWEFALHGAIYHQASVEYSGDHLFVDRLTYNFRRPARGEIVVFRTRDIPQIAADQFYVKRLIGLPGETITIGDDRHVRVNGVRLDASTPHFKNVYGFDTNAPPRESRYSGHILAPDFRLNPLRTTADQLKVRDKHYAVFGDNTKNSSDSRYWGDFPQQNVIGKAWFVYWPYSSRFGFTTD